LRRPFANKWLNAAVAWELLLLAVVIYVPVLQQPFGTYNLGLADCATAAVLAFSVAGSRDGEVDRTPRMGRSACLNAVNAPAFSIIDAKPD
jgi:hypothetical protein